MAILRLNPEQKDMDDSYFSLEDAESTDNDDFKSFRKKFYHYQYEFGSLAKNINADLLDFYRKLAKDEIAQAFYGASESAVLQLRKFNIDVYIDLNLSKRKAEELFNKTSKKIMLQIKSMYDDLHKANPGVITDYPTIANGRKQPTERLFTSWKKALAAFKESEQQECEGEKILANIAREIGLHQKDPEHCSDEVKIRLENAKRLIEAASKGTLFEEACVAMTAKKTRKKAVKPTSP